MELLLLKNIHIPKIFEHRRKVIFFFRNSSDAEQTKYDKNIKQLGIYLRDKNIYSLVLDIEGDEYVNNLLNENKYVDKLVSSYENVSGKKGNGLLHKKFYIVLVIVA